MSDHFSGPRALAGPAGDICDVYAFPSPQRPGHLVLVLTVLPRADRDSRFSDAIVCRFRLRPLTPSAGSGFDLGDAEWVIDCTFGQPRDDDGRATVQSGRCTVRPADGEPVEIGFTVGDLEGAAAGDTRVFAGLRSDPFFLDLPGFMRSVKTGRLAFAEVGQNSLAGFNVLGVVVELDAAPLLATGPLVAVVGETVVAGALPVRLERVGRPEIKNAVLSWKEFDRTNRDLEVRDLYNLEDPFHMSGDYRGVYRARFDANLAMLDRLDGRVDWPTTPEGTHPLTELLLADHLVLDLGKPFSPDGFLEIERSVLDGRPHQTCGGRWLDENAMDALYTWLVNAGRGPRISDGVPGPTRPAVHTFPYLADPNPPQAPNARPPDTRAPHAHATTEGAIR
jgi:hypothetical protein